MPFHFRSALGVATIDSQSRRAGRARLVWLAPFIVLLATECGGSERRPSGLCSASR
jgi:hypothetical protein